MEKLASKRKDSRSTSQKKKRKVSKKVSGVRRTKSSSRSEKKDSLLAITRKQSAGELNPTSPFHSDVEIVTPWAVRDADFIDSEVRKRAVADSLERSVAEMDLADRMIFILFWVIVIPGSVWFLLGLYNQFRIMKGE